MSAELRHTFRHVPDPRVHVSVLVPIYGVEKYIGRCAEALFSQTMNEGIEFIFVDDCTPDGSMDILERVLARHPERRSQVTIAHNEQNSGSAETRNRATALARGEYIIHCDSDDCPEPQMYATLYDAARRTGADAVVCGYFLDYGSREIAVIDDIPSSGVAAAQAILDGVTHNALWNKLIRRSLFDKLTFWCTPGVNMYEDVSLLPRLLRHAVRVATVKDALYHYNLANPGAYTRNWNESVIKQIVRAADIITGAFDGDSAISLDRFKARVILAVSKHGAPYFNKYMRGRYPEANKYILKSNFGAFTLKDRLRCWTAVHGLTPLTALIDLADRVRKR